MNTVEPIRDMGTVNDIADYLKSQCYRNYVMFVFGIYSGLRISDILRLRVRDVRGKKDVYIREKKTGKEKSFPINPELRPILNEYIKDKADYEYLIKSAKGENKAISRQQAYDILSKAGKKFGISKIGTHTLRKTFLAIICISRQRTSLRCSRSLIMQVYRLRCDNWSDKGYERYQYEKAVF